jgi:hypothetical protein
MQVMGRKFTHPVNVIHELNHHTLGIDFINAPQLTYDVIAKQVKFVGANGNTIVAVKQTILAANADIG